MYQNYKNNQGKHHSNYEHGILTSLITNAIVDATQAARFKKQDAIFAHMLPYVMGLRSIEKQVQLSKINVIMLATAESVLWESTTF